MTLESLQHYDQCWQPKEPQEDFYCKCGEPITEKEHAQYNGLCYWCRHEEPSA